MPLPAGETTCPIPGNHDGNPRATAGTRHRAPAASCSLPWGCPRSSVRPLLVSLFGVLAFTLPAATVATLVLVFGAYVLVDGIFAMATAIAGRTMTPGWWILLLQGLLGIGLGALTLFKCGAPNRTDVVPNRHAA